MSLFRKLTGLLAGAPGDRPATLRGASSGPLRQQEPRLALSEGATSAEWKSRGNQALAANDVVAAVQCYRRAAAADSADPLARLNLGFALLETGDAAGAEQALLQALALRRDGDDFMHEAQFLMGQACWRQGELHKALAGFEAATALKPDFAEAKHAKLELLLQLGRHADVLDALKGVDEPSVQMQFAKARALDALGRHQEALDALDALLASQPDHVKALEGRGNVMLHLGRSAEAITALERAIAVGGPTGDRLSSSAVALQRLGRYDAALQAVERALNLEPTHREALYNRGHILLEKLQVREAVEASNTGLTLYPHDADMRWSRAWGHLLLGNFESGWADHEARWQASVLGVANPRPDFGRPYWTGRESLEGRTILLFPEQGLGDSIQFLRFVPAVAERAGAVVLYVPASLASLAVGLAPNCRIVADASSQVACDYVCSLMSLPLVLGTTLENLPRRSPYLTAEPARVQAWRSRLDPAVSGHRVGIVWSGNPAHRNDHNRSIPLSMFKEMAPADCQFVSIQPQVRDTDQQALAEWSALLRWGEELRDFSDTAALVSALDLIISVDTSVAHLAGALGRPVWILLPHCPDWRWMLEREDSPWYPSARLFRQDATREWLPVLQRVRAELREVGAAAHGAAAPTI